MPEPKVVSIPSVEQLESQFEPPTEITIDTLFPHFAPHIIKNEFAKTVALIQMFTSPSNNELFHVIYVGDPSSGKGKILREVKYLHPICGYVSKKTTMGGLIGVAKAYGVEGGIMKDCNGGLLCADEIGRMDKGVRDTFLEPMEDGDCHISAFGQTVTIQCHINILAAANPVGEIWGPKVSTAKLPFGKAMMSRFHIILPMKDLPVENYDNTLADAFYKKLMTPKKEQDEKQIFFHRLITDRIRRIPQVYITQGQMQTIVQNVNNIKRQFGNKLIICPRLVHGIAGATMGLARLNDRKAALDDDIQMVTDLVYSSLQEWDRL